MLVKGYLSCFNIEKKMIWFKNYTLEEINVFNKKTLLEHLDIQITALNSDSIEGTMPVDERTVQPMRLLHGGASCVLAESLASIGSFLIVDPTKEIALGQHIEATHLRPANSGRVRGVATIVHKGSTMHMWSIKIYNQDNKLICDSKLVMAIRSKETKTQ